MNCFLVPEPSKSPFTWQIKRPTVSTIIRSSTREASPVDQYLPHPTPQVSLTLHRDPQLREHRTSVATSHSIVISGNRSPSRHPQPTRTIVRSVGRSARSARDTRHEFGFSRNYQKSYPKLLLLRWASSTSFECGTTSTSWSKSTPDARSDQHLFLEHNMSMANTSTTPRRPATNLRAALAVEQRGTLAASDSRDCSHKLVHTTISKANSPTKNWLEPSRRSGS